MVNKLYLVTPRGFCAGVEMAIKALHWLLKIYDETIYCYHEIVHNKWIVKEFEKNYLDTLRKNHNKILKVLKAGKLTDEVLDTLNSVANETSSQFE